MCIDSMSSDNVTCVYQRRKKFNKTEKHETVQRIGEKLQLHDTKLQIDTHTHIH